MAGRIVLFGATGYTGRLTADALVRRGQRPVLAGRDPSRLSALADSLGGLETVVADSERPESVHALVGFGDVLVSAVGPFSLLGAPAVEAALRAGAHYVDCSGEPQFVRDIFERHGPRAEEAGCALLTGIGFDWVAGTLAGALALREAGEDAAGVEIGYFSPGTTVTTSVSPGTRATLVSVMAEQAFAWRGGRLVTVRPMSSRRTFALPSGRAEAVSVGAAEHITLPRLAPGLRDVGVYIGWLGPASRPTQALMLATSFAVGVPGVKTGLQSLATTIARTTSEGPNAAERARTRSLVVAEARDAHGAPLSEVRMEGIDPYELSGRLLAWVAAEAVEGRLRGVGALGPVEAFGLDALAAGVEASGLSVMSAH